MQEREESTKSTLNNPKHSSAYLLHLLPRKHMDIAISKLQVSNKTPNVRRVCSSLCRAKCCCSHRETGTFIEHLRPQGCQLQLLSEQSSTHNSTPAANSSINPAASKECAELHRGPHLMSLTPWNCLFRAWLSAHSAARKESSSSSSSFCGREGGGQ